MKTILVAILIGLATGAFAGDDRGTPAILGYIETNNRVITLYAGARPVYTVSTKEGQRLAERISLSELAAKFPELRRVVDGTYARNGRTLWAGM